MFAYCLLFISLLLLYVMVNKKLSKEAEEEDDDSDFGCVARWRIVIGRWTCDEQVAGSIPGHRAVGFSFGQVVDTQCASVTKHY